MQLHHIDSFVNGWFIGNFDPTLIKSDDIEVAVKSYKAGEKEPSHFQLTATEITVVISGKCLLGGHVLNAGDVLVIDPMEPADFEALEDCIVVACKSPSLPNDKVLSID